MIIKIFYKEKYLLFRDTYNVLVSLCYFPANIYKNQHNVCKRLHFFKKIQNAPKLCAYFIH